MDDEIISQEQKIEPEITKRPKNNKALVAILIAVVLILLSVVGVGVYYYLNQEKCATLANSTEEAAKDNDAIISSPVAGLISNDIYKIYTYNEVGITVNGDPCNSVSVLSLYKDQSIAVLSDSSCLGGEVKIGTYDIYSDKVMIEFQTRVGLDDQSKLNLREDISFHGSGNTVLLTLNNDGTATSSLFTGIRTFIKK
ncbi:MAG: hypothetical protein WCQ49_02435 [Candidatus Saccharibacteria bacterium]